MHTQNDLGCTYLGQMFLDFNGYESLVGVYRKQNYLLYLKFNLN